MMRVAAALACVAAMGLGCLSTSGPPEGLAQSLATNGCGPADGPATVIYLARDPIEGVSPSSYPYVRLTILEDVTQLAGKTFRVENSALYVTGPGTFELPRLGSVAVDRVGADRRIEGKVHLEFSPRDVVGTFSAGYVQLEILCG